MTSDAPQLSPVELERLILRVPPPPQSQCTLRYRGDDRAVTLSALSARDRAAVLELYAAMMTFDERLHARPAASNESEDAIALAASFPLDHVLSVARTIGSGREDLSEEVRHALHDVRGGALTSLLIEVQRTLMGRGGGSTRALRTLTSDHLKVMRNALLELDDERRAVDLAPRSHSIERLAETLGRVTGEGKRGRVDVGVRCSFTGAITMSCMELGALDRAVLNIVNNAVRHSAGDRVEVALVPSSSAPGADLRILVSNAVDDEHAQALHARFGEDLPRIFVETFSTTGSGDGLKICVDFVSAAYGLARNADTVRAGLVGAVIDGGRFVAWMHWPAVA